MNDLSAATSVNVPRGALDPGVSPDAIEAMDKYLDDLLCRRWSLGTRRAQRRAPLDYDCGVA